MKQIYDFSILRELRKKESMTIENLSAKSGVSASVISKLERNQCLAELDTIYRLARAFNLAAADLISLAEGRIAHRAAAATHVSGGFTFEEVTYGNAKCLRGRAAAGGRVSKPHLHRNDYELCWVVNGKLLLDLPNERHELSAGESIQFDALLEHTYEALEDCEIILVHIRKNKRF